MERIKSLYAEPEVVAGKRPVKLTVIEDGDTAIVVNDLGALWYGGPTWACYIEAARWNNYFARPVTEAPEMSGGVRYWKVRVGE